MPSNHLIWSFPMSQLYASGGQNIGASASVSVLPMNIQGWFSLELTSLISLLSNRLSRVFFSTTVWKHLQHLAFFMVRLSHLYMATGKTTALTIHIFVGKMMALLFNTLSRFVVAFLPRSKCLLILWLQSPKSTVILKPKKIKSVTVSIFPHLFAIKWWGWMQILWIKYHKTLIHSVSSNTVCFRYVCNGHWQ